MYINVADAAKKFNISKRRVQLLCKQGRIEGAYMVNGVWMIPSEAQKPTETRKNSPASENQLTLSDDLNVANDERITLDQVCEILSISTATANNWIRLGKLAPCEDGRTFEKAYIEKLVCEIKSDKDSRLKSRRNKKSVKGKVLYKDYVENENNRNVVGKILEECSNISEEELRVIIAFFASQLYFQSRKIPAPNNDFLKCAMTSDDYAFRTLIADLLGNIDLNSVDRSNILFVFQQKVEFVPSEDTLGFIYISLQDLSQRKQAGAYYTPARIVKKLLDNLFDCGFSPEEKTYFDPCCGTGNFLIGLLERGVSVNRLYGQDIDEISVLVTRINMFLLNRELSNEQLYTQFTCGDTLKQTFPNSFSVILGNPPWGYDFTKEEKSFLLKHYKTGKSKVAESYDLFIEKGIELLENDGYLAYVLPEALLNVNSHYQARDLIVKKASFKFALYLGNAFSGVQCPTVILCVKKDSKGTSEKCRVFCNDTVFVIGKDRHFDASLFSLNINDEQYDCLNAIESVQNPRYLANNAKFALGIVTGDNKKYIKNTKDDGFEVVLKGSDILRYAIKKNDNYIYFAPKSFQQVAPTELYRAEEKLLYRFISEVPVFAYDNKQMLSLNSCNIVIPEIPELNIKYILAVLNSSVAAYFISKKFNSVKLLRLHIEQIPIPAVSSDVQAAIIKKVDRIMSSSENISSLYTDLDNDIMNLFKLSSNQIRVIQEALQGKSLFLGS